MTKGIALPFYVGVSPTLGIRGLIASRKIKSGEVIERCPAIVYPKNAQVIEQTIFNYYVFDWDDDHEALALGYGSLCNHSYRRNVEVDFEYTRQQITFTAITDINVGEELLINYNDDSTEPIDQDYLTFDNPSKS